MVKMSMCRICLAKDGKMHLLLDTHLQKVYEDLTAMPLTTEDNRPVQACHICHARLQNCYKLRTRCLRSEEFFTQIVNSSIHLERLHQEDSRNELKITPVIHLSMGDMEQKIDSIVKKEASDSDVEPEKEDPGSILLDMVNGLSCPSGPQQGYYVDLEVTKTEPDDLVRDVDNGLQRGYYVELEVTKTEPDNLVRDLGQSTSVAQKENSIDISLDDIAAKSLQCNECGKLFGSKYGLNRHSLLHTGEKPYQCNVCLKRYSSKYHLDKHIPIHRGEIPFQCKVCKKSYSCKNSLQRHIDYIHNKKALHDVDNVRLMLVTCDICKKDLSSKRRLINHMRTHIGEMPYKCNVCRETFSDQNTFIEHKLVHDDYAFQCDKCDKSFKRKHQLEAHIRLHTGEKLFECSACKTSFIWKAQLRNHIRMKPCNRINQ